MNFNPITFLLIIVLLYPIIRGFSTEYSSKNLKEDLYNVQGDICFIASLIIALYFCKKVFVQHDEKSYIYIYNLIPMNLISNIEKRPSLIYIIILPIFMYITYKLIRALLLTLNHITFYPILDVVEVKLRNKGELYKRTWSALFELPKAISYILILTFIFNALSIINLNNSLNKYLEKSALYSYICTNVVIPITNSSLARQLPSIINNSFRVEIKNINIGSIESKTSKTRTTIYYNGVTLEEGIKSNESIDNFAKKLVSTESATKLKAKKIYDWIGSNIDYDYSKASKVLNNDFNIQSGAIQTYEGKKGICFDYSCLYVAMCRASGLQVRLVTGDGFNGVSWVSHAWNEVYSLEENKWINVDTTFYKGGNYFNSKRFDIDHKDTKIIGEW